MTSLVPAREPAPASSAAHAPSKSGSRHYDARCVGVDGCCVCSRATKKFNSMQQTVHQHQPNKTRTHASRLDGGRKSNHRELQIGRVALHEGLDNGRGVLRSDASEYRTPGILARRQCTVTNVHVLHLEQRVVGRRTMVDREGLPTIQLIQRSIAVHEGNKVQVDLFLQRWGLNNALPTRQPHLVLAARPSARADAISTTCLRLP